MNNGYRWVVNIDLETYFDTVIKAYNNLCKKKVKSC